MDKIVGKKFILLVLLFSNSLGQARSFLRIVDRKGIPIKEAYVNVPFKMELVLENVDRTMRAPKIPGIEAFRVEGNETRMNIVNGQTTAIYGYHLRAEKEGAYTLGPLDDAVFGPIEPIRFKVSNDTQSRSEKNESSQPFARLTMDKKNVALGEKIHFSLRFYYQNDSVSLENISQPEIPDISFNNHKGPLAGRETIKKKIYEYIEWEWDGSPCQTGLIEIPAYALDFSERNEHDENDLFSLFFQRRKTRKRIYSNSLELQVEPLPSCSKEVHGIGCFTNFSLNVKPGIAREGEGIVLTLTIVGDNELEKLEIFPLKNMPDALKWYDSKNYSTGNDNHIKKSFEYIIQGLKPGDWEIPAQEFTFFDTKKRMYKTLETVPTIITITPSSINPVQSASAMVQESIPATLDIPMKVNQDSDICPLNMKGPIQGYNERSIPWMIFGFLLCVPAALLLTRKIRKLGTSNKKNIRKNYFDKARRSLVTAEKNNSYAQTYPIFLELFKALFSVSEASITEETIEKKMQEKKFSTEQIQRWRLFFLQISESAFFPTKQNHENQEQLWSQAHSWLDNFERQL